ncbi:MAG: crossover junction endodeoxyribonuclease RuvC [Chloroflexota bacterium]
MLVLGIDPGIATTGYGIVDALPRGLQLVEYGAITTPPDLAAPQRLRILYAALSRLLRQYHPAEAVVERLFFSRNITTAIAVGQARGVVLLALADAEVAVAEYSPNEVKQAIVGYGGGRKDQVQQMVRILLHMDVIPTPDDAADALALAICHIHGQRMRELLSQAT